MLERDQAVYVISVAAELAGVHPQTLRVYERKGLLQPERTAGNTRRYSLADIERLNRIQELTRSVGVNLAGVKMILDLEHQLDRMRRRLDHMAGRLERETAEEVREMVREATALVPVSQQKSLKRLLKELQAREAQRGARGAGDPIPMGPGGSTTARPRP